MNIPSLPAAPEPPRATRWLQRWYWLTPNLAVMMFIAAMAGLLWLLRGQEIEEQRSALVRDMQWAEQNIRLHLLASQESLTQLARDVAQGTLDEDAFLLRAGQIMSTNGDISRLAWIDAGGASRWSAPFERAGEAGGGARHDAATAAFEAAGASRRIQFSAAFTAPTGEPVIEAHVPVFRQREFLGTVVAVYSLRPLVYALVPDWFAEKYRLSILDAAGQIVASTSSVARLNESLTHETGFEPFGQGLRLRATAFRTSAGLARHMLVVLVVGLSLIIVWSLWSLRRYMRAQRRTEQALRAETAFRKSMEDSTLTGLRVIDMNGRITYVNPAFCRMTGFREDELVGRGPPFPYWPAEEETACWNVLRTTLAGKAPENGMEVRLTHRDGQRFDVLIFVAPLLDDQGQQLGWMGSMVDITERKRAREALRASHQRFTAVLEGLDAAVVVSDLQNGAALFHNRLARAVYGTQQTTLAPVGEAASEEFDREVLSATDGRWYHIRCRPIRWVDGRDARIELATDITPRRQAEEMARQQLEKLQVSSRLTTMGEMASTLAHELNQPLAAIANYCSGCVTRIQNGAVSTEELLAVLQKASAQAQRAGKIIRRVREFVKKTAPQCLPCPINEVVEEAVSFAEIDAAKRGVSVQREYAGALPDVSADRIMIEQVLLNLVRNAADAVQECPPARREIRVRTRLSEAGQVEVEVADRGHGIAPAVAEKLFSPFFTTKPEGMGMGLSICRSIIEFHKGRLWAEPNPGGGTVFRFTLPLAEATAT